MKRFVFRFGIALLTFLLGVGVFIGWKQFKGVSHSDELTLYFVADTVVRVDKYPSVRLYITNNGKDTVTLVHPGDGSADGWRTPILQSFIVEADADGHPANGLEQYSSLRCGNINALDWDEVFTLAPGETKEIKAWLRSFRKPGRYKVKFFYANLPWIEWSGIELGTHNPIAMWRAEHSTECALSSNEVFFTVNE